ncbi:MAG: RidA family protein [Clostridia bacterium]|nr:RidA family protein [Clostridia bacterium]
MLNNVHTDRAPAAIGPYSQAISAGELIFTSGQIPLDPVSGQVVGEDITAQTHRVCQNLGAVLEAAGSSLASAIKTTCFLQSMDDFAAFNAVYAEYFTGKPARSCVAVKTLPRGVLVEVEVVALREQKA